MDYGKSSGPLLKLKQPLMVLTSAYPPRSSGTATIMYNLLVAFSPDSIVLLTKQPTRLDGDPHYANGHVPSYFLKQISISDRLNVRFQRLQSYCSPWLVARLARRHRCGAVVGVFPDLVTIDIARRAAHLAGLPFVPYLHDTIVESFTKGSNTENARRVQDGVFSQAARVLVVNQGMADLYAKKYDLITPVVPHGVWEKPTSHVAPASLGRTVFFGGGVYGINDKSLVRVCKALQSIPDASLVVGTPQTDKSLARYGIAGNGIKHVFFGAREEYIEALSRQGVLLVALNDPDESREVGEEELATIFSTKIVEYLLAGRPILAHCPEHYFMARFLREAGCGLVVSSRSPELLREAILHLLAGGGRVRELIANGREALSYFDGPRVTGIFRREIQEVLDAQDS